MILGLLLAAYAACGLYVCWKWRRSWPATEEEVLRRSQHFNSIGRIPPVAAYAVLVCLIVASPYAVLYDAVDWVKKRRRRDDAVAFVGEEPEFADLCGWTKPGWYFWDETGSQCYGPYVSREAATVSLKTYVEELNGGRR